MMEQTGAREDHEHTVLIASFDNVIVPDASTGLNHVVHTGLSRPFDVVAKGEEGIGADCKTGLRCNPGFLFFQSQGLGASLENALPDAVAKDIFILVGDVDIDGVVAIGAADPVNEVQAKHFRMLSQQPVVGFVACQSGAVDTALLTGTYADGLAVFHITDGVGLGIFQRKQRNGHITAGLIGQIGVRGNDVGEGLICDSIVIDALLKGDAVDLAMLDGIGNEIGIDLYDVVVAFFLSLQDLQCFLGIIRGNYAVRNFVLQVQSGSLITSVG